MDNPFQELYERLDRIEGLLVIVKDNKAPESEGEEERLLNVRETARYLGDAVATLYNRTSKNEIPFYKRGKKVYFKKSELLASIEEGRVKANLKSWMRPHCGRINDLVLNEYRIPRACEWFEGVYNDLNVNE